MIFFKKQCNKSARTEKIPVLSAKHFNVQIFITHACVRAYAEKLRIKNILPKDDFTWI